MKRLFVICLAVVMMLGALSSLTGCSGPSDFVTEDGHDYVLNEDGKTYAFRSLDSAFAGEEFTVPETITENNYKVTALDNSAFQSCESLQYVLTIGTITRNDGDDTFKRVFLHESITTIEENVFYNCTALKLVILPSGVTFIGDYAFSCCSSLASITLPEGLTTIGTGAFTECTSLKTLTIPESATSLEGALNGSKLESVTYGGTMEAWYKATKTDDSHQWSFSITCSDGTIAKSEG